MSKRKRNVPAGPGDSSGASEAADRPEAVKEDMAHVGPDVLAGSPDVFAPKADEPAASEASEPAATEAEAAELSEVVAEPAEPTSTPPLPDTDVAAPLPAVSAPASIPTPAAATPPAPKRRNSSSLALGVVLLVVGLFALGVAVLGVDMTQAGWPLFVLVPGLTLLVVGFFGAGAGASVPGGIITMTGLVLAYQNSTGDWASWAYVWALIAPGGVGLGMYLQALRDRNPVALRRGRMLIVIGFLMFMIGFVFFESILKISDVDYGVFGKAALPLLLILVGAFLLVRNAQRNRRA